MKPLQITFTTKGHNDDHNGCRTRSPDGRIFPLRRYYTAPSPHATRGGTPKCANMAESGITEQTGLLWTLQDGQNERHIDSNATTLSPGIRRLSTINSIPISTRTQRTHRSYGGTLSNRKGTNSGLPTPGLYRSAILDNVPLDERVWYDQFTSTDWVHDNIADANRALELRKHKSLRGRVRLMFDAAQGWIVVALVGCLTAAVAYLIDVTEAAIFDLKSGFCQKRWYMNKANCCAGEELCESWLSWSQIVSPSDSDSIAGDYAGYILGCILFAMTACFITLFSKEEISRSIASTLDENLGAERKNERSETLTSARGTSFAVPKYQPLVSYYSAAGSGVAEVKVILSGFVLHGYLGIKTLLLKCPALIFSVASGMSLGKEGPFVHIATCIGNIICRFFPKYNYNDAKRREVLAAAAASGVAVAFGSPLGGVLFALEEVSYYFPSQTLFRTFFCCIAAALSLKFLNPYGTNKIVLFEVRYNRGWHFYELFSFVFLGVVGGLAGAGFIKASRYWATTFRRWKIIRRYPWAEVFLVALVTGIISFGNRYAKLPVAELLFQLASPCGAHDQTGLCPQTREEIPGIILHLFVGFLIKALLTIITFGIKVPAGIYVPSMVCGGLMGRIVGHVVQYLVLSISGQSTINYASAMIDTESGITPGVYALVAAGATMCGVTRLSVTLAVILFELTGSLDHVLPFAIGVLTAKWTADFVEPSSIYDLLINMNSYPFMDNKRAPLFEADTQLGDITPRFRGERIIDISISAYVRATDLRAKLNTLHHAGELDGGLPIICEKVLVGLIPAPDLEFALDNLQSPEDRTLCLMSYTDRHIHSSSHVQWLAAARENNEPEELLQSSAASISSTAQFEEESAAEADFVSFVDPAPIALESCSPMNLVYQCFSKLGLRYVCVLKDGEYRGMVHKKLFVKYLKSEESKQA